jgi:phosphopentomutase
MRALLIVLDSVGVGAAPDAAAYGDEGADTLGHILDRCPALRLPALWSLGLGRILGRDPEVEPKASWGRMRERSTGKDSTTGHWELAGAVLGEPFGLFGRFPPELVGAVERDAGVEFIGNCAASGTAIIDDLGPEHLRSGRPILYTSADSVLQIAAHEEVVPIERLYEICRVARRRADAYRIGRVIARPFVGETKATFKRTPNRRDYAVPPPEPTLLDRLVARGSRVIAIGKIGDIFAHRGISEIRKGVGNMEMFDKALGAIDDAGDGDLVFANFVDFDTEFGHRRDVAGYAAALEAFDRRIPEALTRLKPGDLFLLTADHGNDPTWRGTDHTRERIPVIGMVPGMAGGSIGLRPTFADIGETVAEHLGLPPGPHGTSFYAALCSPVIKHA